MTFTKQIQIGDFDKLNKGNQSKVTNFAKWLIDLDYTIANVEVSTTDCGQYGYIIAHYKGVEVSLRVDSSNAFWLYALHIESTEVIWEVDTINKIRDMKDELVKLTIIIDQLELAKDNLQRPVRELELFDDIELTDEDVISFKDVLYKLEIIHGVRTFEYEGKTYLLSDESQIEAFLDDAVHHFTLYTEGIGIRGDNDYEEELEMPYTNRYKLIK